MLGVALAAVVWVLLRVRRARKARRAVATGGAAIAYGSALLDNSDRHRSPGSRFRGSGGSM